MAEPLPEGYRDCYIDGLRVALPHKVAAALTAEHDARRSAELAARVAAEDCAPGEAAVAPGAPEAAPADGGPAPGFHRVLHRLEAQTAGAGDDRALALRTPDTDVQLRHKLLRERLLALGPDRRIGRPADWRVAVDALAQSMPNFEAPIRLLRHTLATGEATGQGVRLPPMLLLGPPGVGKTLFSQSVAELLGVPHATVALDTPTAANILRGSDAHWGNTQAGLLFNLLCLGEVANPVVLLDELDKASTDSSHGGDPLAQLHGVLEPQTACCLQDISTGIEFDASLVGYVATANSLRGMGMPLLTRFEVFEIQAPDPDQSVEVARRVIAGALTRLAVSDRLAFERRCAYVLARLSPRLMRRVADRLVAAALHDGRMRVTEDEVWAELGLRAAPRWH